jgi:hypothetical protein
MFYIKSINPNNSIARTYQCFICFILTRFVYTCCKNSIIFYIHFTSRYLQGNSLNIICTKLNDESNLKRELKKITYFTKLSSELLSFWTVSIVWYCRNHYIGKKLVLMHLALLARFVPLISTSLSILVTQMCVLYHNFDCIFCCYLPPN